MAFQMAVMLGLGAYIGVKLDQHFHTKMPYLTAVSVLIFLFAAFYLVLKDLIIKKKD